MRPIDADALYRRIKEECNPYGKPSIGWEDGQSVMMWIRCAPTINDWVSVKDRLPRDQDIVIVAINDDSGDTPYKYTYFGWYMSEAKCWIVDDEIRRGEVYAWKPLPEPPEVSKNG